MSLGNGIILSSLRCTGEPDGAPLHVPGWVAGARLVKQSDRAEQGGRFIYEAAVRFWPLSAYDGRSVEKVGSHQYVRLPNTPREAAPPFNAAKR